MNSTLGSVVPLAMFFIHSGIKCLCMRIYAGARVRYLHETLCIYSSSTWCIFLYTCGASLKIRGHSQLRQPLLLFFWQNLRKMTYSRFCLTLPKRCVHFTALLLCLLISTIFCRQFVSLNFTNLRCCAVVEEGRMKTIYSCDIIGFGVLPFCCCVLAHILFLRLLFWISQTLDAAQ